jgi:hypothetical protein
MYCGIKECLGMRKASLPHSKFEIQFYSLIKEIEVNLRKRRKDVGEIGPFHH